MKKLWQLITALKNAIGNLLFLGIIIVIVIAIVGQESATIPESAVLFINPQGVMVEQKRLVDPVERFLSGDEGAESETLVRDVTDAIKLATNDDRIEAIVLDLSGHAGGTISQYEEITEVLSLFKDQGKPVYTFDHGYSQSQYYLAAFADKVYLATDSQTSFDGVFLHGLGAYRFYLKSALEKLHVDVRVLKAGVYKDAGETFQRDDMSDYSKESNQELLASLWGNYLATIAQQRDITIDQLVNYIDNYDKLLGTVNFDAALLAVEQGLVDEQISIVQWREKIREMTSVESEEDNRVSMRAYLAAMRSPIPIVNPTSDKIAVIVAKGQIYDGEQAAGDIGGDSLASLVKQAREDKTIKAVVVRVDSPGGSPSASELIRSELVMTQESGKPVVISMGGYAASGGYWIATTANKIFASESTITGSIGVFGMIPNFARAIEKLGVYSDGVGTNTFSNALNPFETANPRFEYTLQQNVNRIYNKFITLVSEGRGLDLAEVDKIAQGRVWSGASALELGLIDAIGGTSDAVKSAAILAGLNNYDVIYLEKQLSPRELIIKQVLESTAAYLPRPAVGLFSIVPRELRVLIDMAKQPGLYLQCLGCQVSY